MSQLRPPSGGSGNVAGAAFGNGFRKGADIRWDDATGDDKSAAGTVGGRLAESDPLFAEYMATMRECDKSYVSSNRAYLQSGLEQQQRTMDAVKKLIAFSSSSSEEAISEAAANELIEMASQPNAVDVDGRLVLVRWSHAAWPDFVAREYIAKKRRFGARLSATSGRVVVRIAALLALCCAALWVAWPVWSFLVDVDAGDHYRTLELSSSANTKDIKAAYRRLIRLWHPDHRPGCGEECKAKTREIQHAYDVLLSKGDKATASELKQKYTDAVEQLLAFVFYRGFSMAFNTAIFLSYFLTVAPSMIRNPMTRQLADAKLTLAVKIIVLAIFSIVTIIHVTGFNVIMLLMSGYRVLLQLREDDQAGKRIRGAFDDGGSNSRTSGGRDMVKAATLGNYNLRECLLFMVVPAIAAHALYEYAYTVSIHDLDSNSSLPIFSWSKFLFKVVYGTLLVCSHVIQFPPNLFHNLKMMECLVPLSYFSVRFDQATGRSTRSVTVMSFVMAEFGVLFDDVFAFATHIPAPYRVVVLLCHALFLVQFFSLPWATPIDVNSARSLRLQQKFAKLVKQRTAAIAATSTDGSAAATATMFESAFSRFLSGAPDTTDSGGATGAQRTDSSVASAGTATSKPDPSRSESPQQQPRVLDAKELALLADLDRDVASWASLRQEMFARPGPPPAKGTRLHALSDSLARCSDINRFVAPPAVVGSSISSGRVAVNDGLRVWMPLAVTLLGVCALFVRSPTLVDEISVANRREAVQVAGTMWRDPYIAAAAAAGAILVEPAGEAATRSVTPRLGTETAIASGLHKVVVGPLSGDVAAARIALAAAEGRAAKDGRKKSSQSGNQHQQQQQSSQRSQSSNNKKGTTGKKGANRK